MATMEIFRLNSEGASWVPLSEATTSEILDLELAILTNAEIKVTSTKAIEIRTCKICELAHEGLYCDNCFTGERVNCSAPGKFNKWAKVIRLHEINK
jgi:hypothetical protein